MKKDEAEGSGLREQITDDRRELAKTVTALRDKTDVKQRVKEKAADAEIAAADAAGWAGQKAGAVPRLARSAVVTAGVQANKRLPHAVQVQIARMAALVRGRIRLAAAALSALVALLAVNRLRRRT